MLDDLQVVILAAGKGTRMGDIETPKVLVEFKGKPLLAYILGQVKALGLRFPPIVVVGYKHELVEAAFKDECIFTYQAEQLGTAHAVLAAKNIITAPSVLILYGDMPFVTVESLKKLAVSHTLSSSSLSMLTTVAPNFEGKYSSLKAYGRIIRKGYEEVLEIKEFKDCSFAEQLILEVNPGIYLIETNKLWEYLAKVKNENSQHEYYLTDIVKIAINDGQEVNTVLTSPDECLGINSFSDLEAVSKNI